MGKMSLNSNWWGVNGNSAVPYSLSYSVQTNVSNRLWRADPLAAPIELSEWTSVFWMKGASGQNANRLLKMLSTTTSFEFEVETHTGGSIVYNLTNDAGAAVVPNSGPGGTFMDDTWHMCSVSVKDNSMKIYVDSTLLRDHTFTNTGTYSPDRIGYGCQLDVGYSQFAGLMTGLWLFPKELTLAEITALHDFSNRRPAVPLIELLMTEGTGNTIADTGSLGEDFTTPSSTWSSDVPS